MCWRRYQEVVSLHLNIIPLLVNYAESDFLERSDNLDPLQYVSFDISLYLGRNLASTTLIVGSDWQYDITSEHEAQIRKMAQWRL